MCPVRRGLLMTHRSSLIGARLILLSVCAVARAGPFTTFDPSGSTNTFARSINGAGAITGSYIGGNIVRAFVRTTDGTITAFDAPGSKNTQATFIDDAGRVVGSWSSNRRQTHGFLRD